MSTLEMKGEVVEMLANVQDQSALEQIRAFIARFLPTKPVSKNADFDGLTKEQYVELEVAIMESDNDDNFISSQTMFKDYEQWLEK